MLIHEGVLALDILMGMGNTAKESHGLKVHHIRMGTMSHDTSTSHT